MFSTYVGILKINKLPTAASKIYFLPAVYISLKNIYRMQICEKFFIRNSSFNIIDKLYCAANKNSNLAQFSLHLLPFSFKIRKRTKWSVVS